MLTKMASLSGTVCIVTGASRGIGKGIALHLAEKGAKVYITGRSMDSPADSPTTGSLRDTVKEAEVRGGNCIPVQCDHSKEKDIEKLFEQVKHENDGRLDILVNNAYSTVPVIFNAIGKKFWELEPSIWDEANNVGLRNHYICAVYAARMMVPRRQGLIVNISSGGGLRYMFNAAYGIGKEACDRMAADCGFELQKHNVAFVSLWPGGIVRTENALTLLESKQVKDTAPVNMEHVKKQFASAETPEFSGQCIAALATDPDVMKLSGKILVTCDLGRKYGLKDAEGHAPFDIFKVKSVLTQSGHTWLATLTPEFVRVPKWLLSLWGNKF